MERSDPPTLLLDEAGTYLDEDNTFLGILNSGHSKAGAVVYRNERKRGGEFVPKRFSTWAPLVIAKIGTIRLEWESRSIVIHIEKKKDDEERRRWREADAADVSRVKKQLEHFAAKTIKLLRSSDPQIPDYLSNRAADNWRPLFAIADLAGKPWSTIARNAAKSLSGEREVTGAEALLAAIQAEFKESGNDHFFSQDLRDRLRERDTDKFGGLTMKGLAYQLRSFRIKPKQFRADGQNRRGYELAAFEDAFARYVPKPKSPS